MARDWVEFVQSQDLPWRENTLGDARPDVAVKRLSFDHDSGAASLLVRYPAGWSAAADSDLAVDEEFLVLDGGLQINGRDYGKFAYAHLPGGYARHSMTSSQGAVVLSFFSAAPQLSGEAGAYDRARLVEYLDAFEVPYTGNFHSEFPPGAGRKTLYEDPETGDQTWILGTMPMRSATRQEVHPIVEEMYLLSGEVHGNRGVMRPGAYFWRPPGEPHGPYGTLTGNLYLFRTKGGKLSTDYIDSDVKFRWWPDYDPVLPDDMKKFTAEAPPGPECY